MPRILPEAFFVILLASSASLFGQQQEKKLMDRINSPDRQQASIFQNKLFASSSGINLAKTSYADTTYSGTKSSNAKTFPGLRSFLGIKNPWFGNKIFVSRSADISAKTGFLNGQKSFAVSQAPTAGYANANKDPSLISADVPVRPFLSKGATQGQFDEISAKTKKELTINEVREMLNKNH
jgi:hypothetical protein